MRLYVNGAQVATKTVGALALNTSAGFFTGRTDTTSTVTIDELALYPTALSAARVQAHFAAASSSSGTAPSNTAPPSASGQATVGSTLTVQPGTWSGTQPITLAYQWRRCDSAGANCANITGATGTTYAVVAGDLGSTLRVRESASNSAGSAFADSAQSAVVTQGSPSAYRDAVVADSPFLYWRLGEASGTFADSSTGGANPGTASGTGLSRNVANLVTANSDGALAFTDATTNIATTTAITGLPTSTVSTEVWFKAAGFANSIDLVNHGYGVVGSSGWALWLTSNRRLHFGLFQSGSPQQVVDSAHRLIVAGRTTSISGRIPLGAGR